MLTTLFQKLQKENIFGGKNNNRFSKTIKHFREKRVTWPKELMRSHMICTARRYNS